MMEVTKKVGSLTITFEGETQKDIVKQLSSLEEVFGESACGKCGSENLRWVVRENDGNEYYELRCLDCGAKLAFGVNKKGGGLFPKRKDGEGNWLPDKGWTKWNNKTKQVE
jgi:DNA-directed RNA polymerase subunit RPC12/RpoP